MLFLENILERLTVITLTADEYYDTLKEAALAGVVGGTTYDALLALRNEGGSRKIYTWNLKHFQQFSPES